MTKRKPQTPFSVQAVSQEKEDSPSQSILRIPELPRRTKTTDGAPPDVRSIPERDESSPAKSFPVVGIGASAGGLEAFTTFLKALPPNTGMSFVLIQHMDPKHESMLHRLLAKDTSMPVTQVVDGTSVEPNRVYVIPPDTEMTIHGGVLKLVARPGGAARHTPIDTFLCALAEDQRSRAIGAILSGIGSDGTKGLQAIKAEGGITLAQDEESAKYPGMPLHAVAAGCVDLTLSPERIAREMARMIRHPYLQIAPQALEPDVSSADDGSLRRIFRQLRSTTGLDIANYKQTTVRRRIGRRMLLRRCETLSQYAKYLGEHPEEVKALFQDVLIHVTSFFRDSEMYEGLKATIFPRISAALEPAEPIRIWVPGCSSGEEVYSIAIALNEFLGDAPNQPKIQIFGTDISDTDIQRARTAIYSESSTSEVSPERVRRFFVKVEGGYQISKALRDLCVFARHDVTRDPPFSRMDLIFCRNLLIYLNSALQKKILSYFHYALKPLGHLVLGKSESVSAAPELYSVEDRKANVYAKVAAPMRAVTQFRAFEPEKVVAVASTAPSSPTFDLRKEAERIMLERYTPPGFVVDAGLQVVHFQGDTSPFLKPAPGEASFSLPKLVAAPLMLEIRAAIHESKKSGALARREGVRLKRDGHTYVTDLEVVPIEGRMPKSSDFLVLFQNLRLEASTKPQSTVAARTKKTQETKEIEQLKRELASTQDSLSGLVEDQEASAEELRAANEEILSSNEELQSTNEELETAKEELQSSNEELTTLNEELQNRNTELSQTASDLNGLLNGVDIPVVILGKDLCIRRFTPAAEKLMNLIPADVGRPISQIRPNIDFPDLDGLAAEVVRNLQPLEKEVRDQKGHWYALRIRPYEAIEDRIEGILIALVDIHDVKQSSTAIVETMRESLLVLDSQLRVLSANPSFYKRFHAKREETEDRFLFELGEGKWNVPKFREMLDEVLSEKKPILDFELEQTFPFIGRKTLLLNAQQLAQAGAGSQKILLAIQDISEQKLSMQMLESEAASLARLSNAASRLWRIRSLREGLDEMLAAAIEGLGADMGNIQTLDAQRGVLVMAVHRGFRQDFLSFFYEVSAKDNSACGRALRSGQRIVIEDVETDAAYAPLLPTARAAGYRAVQSTPLVSRDGTPLGMISTYFRSPHRPNEQDLRRLDLYVRQAVDFIERLTTDEALRDSEATTRALLETAAQAILAINQEGLVELTNITAEHMFGYTRKEMLGQPVEMLIPSRMRDTHRKHRVDYFGHPQNRPMGIGLELAGRRKDGSEFPAEVSLSYLESQKGLRAVAFVSDITQRKQAEADLLISQQELQSLSARLLTSAEDQRKAISRELHDDIGQKLAVLNVRAGEIEALIPGQPNLAAEKSRALSEQIGIVAHEIQEFARGLHPAVLHELGLVVALRSESDAYAHRTGIKVDFSAAGVPEDIPEDISLCLYRVVQESLQNIWKHAESNRVNVQVSATQADIKLTVEDFGKGFDVESAKGKRGLGLVSMQERVRLIGGSFSLKTKVGDGTLVEVHIPLGRGNNGASTSSAGG
ncbi:MAG TPA: chemotaxis protein CheB [Terriglobales bacterium]|nr:chemotaxis protein CheB [Terriglobales bacterium]